jgi:ketosteroid isomerase-like protein
VTAIGARDTAYGMSQRNVDALLKASNAASAATTVDGRESFLSIFDPEIEWISREGAPDTQGEFHGIEEARQYYRRWASAWAEWRWEIEDVRARGDLVVTRTWVTGRGRGSGLVLDMRLGQIWTFRNGKVVRYEALPSWEEALAAAGIRA